MQIKVKQVYNAKEMDEFEKFYNRVLRFLSYRPRSEKEITDFLRRKSARGRVDPLIVKKILKKLKELKFIDDKEFAKWWVEQRTGSKPRGWRVIKMELKQKGISDELITNYKLLITDEKELAKKAIEKIFVKYRQLPREKAYQKLSQFLARRGFDWETIKEVIDEVFKK